MDAALSMVDHRLQQIRLNGNADACWFHNPDASLALDGADFDSLVTGACTLVYVYTNWLRQAHEHHGAETPEVIGIVTGYIAGSLRLMTQSVEPESIPTMVGLATAASLDLSPTLWREQYGPWMPSELNALEATLTLLAYKINEIAQDDTMAIRMVADALHPSD
ncbi:hypothetical protein ABZ897_16295 [Nonomuraea sp. NPDC046802]|uniref:hypothetical protein n=1 Tax=Nonomuraea sp. NPDC046802 TaxID=3154919 RepID=UPI0033FB5128